MRKSSKPVDDDESGELDMSSMIDMVFLLLIFFVVNSTAITVKMDSKVTMPTASNSGKVESANGCIVVNIYNTEAPNGFGKDVFWGTDDGTPIGSEAKLKEYIAEKAEIFTKAGYAETPGLSLYLRGDQQSLYKHSKAVIKVAGECKVVNIMFAAIPPA